ncbi:hypothetical protein C8R32_10464 [Nitrosospira sp. Nsp5]|uniref:Uncharacterized protein n=1 Tax=Nitrosospira multiformis TaxID=1231 RepID=A0ABY0TDX5_9PROT|nr:hypothetical protein C8R32_10464 [Nitrosospira sp. Nsp5]SDQ68399.1 hypothetical protein SAMN05216402_1843 [Nitrosospira multiformis]
MNLNPVVGRGPRSGPHPEGESQIIRNIVINHNTDLSNERSTTGFRLNIKGLLTFHALVVLFKLGNLLLVCPQKLFTKQNMKIFLGFMRYVLIAIGK